MNRNNKIALFLLLVVGGLIGLYMYKKYRVAPTIPLLSQEVFDEQNTKIDLEDKMFRIGKFGFFESQLY